MDHRLLYKNVCSLILILISSKLTPWRNNAQREERIVFTKAFAPQPFMRRAVAAAPHLWLLAVGLCCFPYSLFSAATSDKATAPSIPRLCLLMSESSPIPAPVLSSVTSTKHMQRR